MENIAKEQSCSQCKQVKHLGEYNFKVKSKNIYQTICRDCYRIGYKNAKQRWKIPSYKFYAQPRTGFNGLHRGSKNKGLSCSLKYDEYLQVITQPEVCYYCDMTILEFTEIRDFLMSYSGENKGLLSARRFFKGKRSCCGVMSLDRIFSCDGYNRDNVVKCCLFCNLTRGVLLNEQETKIVGRMFKERMLSQLLISR